LATLLGTFNKGVDYLYPFPRKGLFLASSISKGEQGSVSCICNWAGVMPENGGYFVYIEFREHEYAIENVIVSGISH